MRILVAVLALVAFLLSCTPTEPAAPQDVKEDTCCPCALNEASALPECQTKLATCDAALLECQKLLAPAPQADPAKDVQEAPPVAPADVAHEATPQ